MGGVRRFSGKGSKEDGEGGESQAERGAATGVLRWCDSTGQVGGRQADAGRCWRLSTFLLVVMVLSFDLLMGDD